MPVMKITLSVKLPDVGIPSLLRCAAIIQRPFNGFVEHLVKKQSRWAPQGAQITDEAMDLSIEIEAVPGERLDRELQRQELQQISTLIHRSGKSASKATTPQTEKRAA